MRFQLKTSCLKCNSFCEYELIQRIKNNKNYYLNQYKSKYYLRRPRTLAIDQEKKK